MNHYEVLGVAEDAPVTEIRRAYVRLARRHHPDFFAGGDPAEMQEAEQRMRAVNQAWSVLSDEGRRRSYDRAQGLAGATADGAEPRPFEPFDPGDDDIDPRDLPDVPYRHGGGGDGRLGRVATLAPVASFGASIALGALGMVVGSTGLLALAVAAFVGACLGFVVLPLLALSRASRDD